MTFPEIIQKLVDNRLLMPVMNKHGEQTLRCLVCREIDGHVSGCPVEERIISALRS